MIPFEDFKTVVRNTPLVSIDFIIKNEENHKILLGKRINKPALGYYFTLGGRIFKDETIVDAQKRIFKNELGFQLFSTPNFLGVFEHFYDGSFVDDNISTHYVNLGYEIIVSKSQQEEINNLPKEQHSSYKWFSIKELLQNDEVHTYVKNYFNNLGENN